LVPTCDYPTDHGPDLQPRPAFIASQRFLDTQRTRLGGCASQQLNEAI
jgi:hypothetical protein